MSLNFGRSPNQLQEEGLGQAGGETKGPLGSDFVSPEEGDLILNSGVTIVLGTKGQNFEIFQKKSTGSGGQLREGAEGESGVSAPAIGWRNGMQFIYTNVPGGQSLT